LHERESLGEPNDLVQQKAGVLPMIAEANFPWHKAYLAALSETDAAPLAFRISEAMSALEQRQSSPLPKKEEKLVLRQAQIAIRLMMIRNESCRS
jgi:hypothetical protein